MESITVYIGSGYVIKTPDFDFRQNSLRVSADRSDASCRACEKHTVGVLNMYRLNLGALSVCNAGQDGAAAADVVIQADSVKLQSERALKQLQFVSASFVPQ